MLQTVILVRKSATLMMVAMAFLPSTSSAAHSSGRQIFLQLCAKCHGRNGEGVKGKYDEPLRGEKPLDKLTRYIDRNMPDDAPEKCVGEDAAAVARYIFDTFYSPEARERKNPPRIELARLTNPQYMNTIADLIKHFTGRDAEPEAEHGLKAAYYNSRHFNDDKKAFNRLDRQVEFDFRDASPDKEHGTNEFSIQWRGSVIADETGEYEFILKTPNGVRLWVNDPEEPLIDAWVASGQLTEHRAAIRLIGGRPYPLQVNFFKFKDKTASLSLQWKPPRSAQTVIPSRNLVPVRGTPTFVITTKFPADDSSVGYERGVGVSKAWDDAQTQAALETASYVVARLDALAHTKPGETNRAAKVQNFCEEFVTTAFRHPLSQEQKRLFVADQFKKTAKLEDAVKRVVLLSLNSPHFLYLDLPGMDDDFAIAARLSYALWDSLPDEGLSKAAAARQLHSRDQIQKQARRMLNDPRTRAKMQLFAQHWLQMDRVESLSKDEKIFPGFSPEIIVDLRASLNTFLEETIWSGASDYRQLLLADYLFLNQRLADFYGISTNLTDDFVKVSFGAEQRCGVLTHPYLLAAFSYQKLTSPIHRGVFLTRNIVGRSLRPPPMAMTFKDEDFAPNLTMREKVSQLTKPQACQACHSVINPLGFSLECYDAVGRFRTQENDRPINALSDYVGSEGETIRLAGARDIAQFAITNQQAQSAFIEQLFHHVIKQPVRAYGNAVKQQLRESFVASEFNIQNLLVQIATIAALGESQSKSETDHRNISTR